MLLPVGGDRASGRAAARVKKRTPRLDCKSGGVDGSRRSVSLLERVVGAWLSAAGRSETAPRAGRQCNDACVTMRS